MEFIGLILLIVIAVCLILLGMISRKRKELRDMMYYEQEAEREEFIRKDWKETPVTPSPKMSRKSDPVVPEKTKQITIYEYQNWKRSRPCPQCDGENAITADRCSICGMPF